MIVKRIEMRICFWILSFVFPLIYHVICSPEYSSNSHVEAKGISTDADIICNFEDEKLPCISAVSSGEDKQKIWKTTTKKGGYKKNNGSIQYNTFYLIFYKYMQNGKRVYFKLYISIYFKFRNEDTKKLRYG